VAHALIAQAHYREEERSKLLVHLNSLSDYELHLLCNDAGGQLSNYVLKEETVLDSGKIQHLKTLLPTLQRQGHRVLLFSQFTSVLDLLEEALSALGYAGGFLRMDGSTPVDDRIALIDQFNECKPVPAGDVATINKDGGGDEGSDEKADGGDEKGDCVDDKGDGEKMVYPLFIFLLSTKACGLGINLTAADTVIFHDIDWNPFNDRQAEDRCHRLGQTKPVTIHRLIAGDSIEEHMQKTAERKMRLDEAMQGDGTAGGKKGEPLKKDLQSVVVKLFSKFSGPK
jgi:SWI/SNF-related matrix-associated actin-dependent regulator 1 of chromatin subfamily A